MGKFRIVIVGLLLMCSCEYTTPNKDTVDNKQEKNDRLHETDSSAIESKPTYVLAEPPQAEDLTGINGGQRFVFDPADYGGEWLQENNTDMVRFFIVDVSGLKNISIAAENFFVRTADDVLFSLDPDEVDGTSGSPSYSLCDRNLVLAMNSTVEVIMALNGETYRATLNEPGGQSGELSVPEHSTVDQ